MYENMMKAKQSSTLFCFLCVLLITEINTRTIKSLKGKYVKLSKMPIKPDGQQESIVDIIKRPPSQNGKLDLAFIMDSTGSMASYINSAKQNIREIVEEIVASSGSDVRLALIEYRDHSPQDRTFVTRKHDFTSSVSTMKSWLNSARANGGGDTPEAVAEAMFQATKLSWRQEATKISVMISDAPPHGLVPSEDSSFPEGSPNGHDPMQIARDLAQKGVTLYVIGVEPPIVPYKDFFMALAYITGGQYVPLSVPRLLVNAITGGAQEELSLRKFQAEVQQEIKQASIAGGSGGLIDKQQIAQTVFRRLQKSGAKSKQLVRNNKTLEGPSVDAKLLASKASMAEVRKVFKKGTKTFSSLPTRRLGGLRPSFATIGGFDGAVVGGRGGGPTSRMSPEALIPSSSGSDKLSTKESGITLEQINRLVEKETARLPSV
ncbi:uncharacterized protein LOC127714309 [Mytilus californianus]|uniref:uncharacterized protein LOC127714309 n=1 Tax=Mytilus californianus TaxID=6549 RepID=UPI0022459E07|nr:uncharacterized protein LOC127714309 [Mytilus californianus]